MPIQTYSAEIDVDDEAAASCGCGWNGTAARLAPIDGCALTPGDPSPAGRCPDCDSLAYLVRRDDTAGALRDLLDQLRGVGVYVRGHEEGQWADAQGLSFSRAELALKAYGDLAPKHDGEEVRVDAPSPQAGSTVMSQALKGIGFQVHHGAIEDGELAGRWWWTLSRDGWSECETQEDDSATEAEAWSSALRYALAEAALSMDRLLEGAAT